MSAARPTILIFDSGVGGLTVLEPIRAARPDAHFVYLGDTAFFPYGEREEDELIARVVSVIDKVVAQFKPDLVVIACHTASTLVLPALRACLAIPIIGTVPAIKPAAESSQSRLISVLATTGTVKRDYTAALIRDFAGDCDVTLVSASRLASFAEDALHGLPVADADLRAEIEPAFIQKDRRRTDRVVLACTHYPLLLTRLERVAPWPVSWINPAPAIARRVVQLLGDAPTGALGANDGFVMLTGADDWSSSLLTAFAERGLSPIAI